MPRSPRGWHPFYNGEGSNGLQWLGLDCSLSCSLLERCWKPPTRHPTGSMTPTLPSTWRMRNRDWMVQSTCLGLCYSCSSTSTCSSLRLCPVQALVAYLTPVPLPQSGFVRNPRCQNVSCSFHRDTPCPEQFPRGNRPERGLRKDFHRARVQHRTCPGGRYPELEFAPGHAD